MNKDKVKLLICAMVSVTVIICGIFFWPTLYRYDKISDGKRAISVKINRITGTIEIFGKNVETLDWNKSYNPGGDDHPQLLSLGEKAKIIGNKPSGDELYQNELNSLPNDSYITIPDKTDFSFKSGIYNGTMYHISKLIVIIEAKNIDWTTRWKRRYQADLRRQIQPFSSGAISVKMSDTDGVAIYIWYIDEAISP